jgi:hypothetical protein
MLFYPKALKLVAIIFSFLTFFFRDLAFIFISHDQIHVFLKEELKIVEKVCLEFSIEVMP